MTLPAIIQGRNPDFFFNSSDISCGFLLQNNFILSDSKVFDPHLLRWMLRNQIPPWKSRPGRGSWSRPGDAPAASVLGALWEEPWAPHCSRPLPAPRLARSPPPGICPAFPKSNAQSSKGYVTKILFNQTENQGVSPLSHFHPLPSTLWPWAPLSAFSQIQNRRATFLSYLSQEAMIEIQIKGKLLPCQLNYLAIKQFLEAFPSAESTELLVEEAWGLDLYVFFFISPFVMTSQPPCSLTSFPFSHLQSGSSGAVPGLGFRQGWATKYSRKAK